MVVVVPEELIDGLGTCTEGEQAMDVEAFIVNGTEEAFDLPLDSGAEGRRRR